MNQYIIGQQDPYRNRWGHLTGPYETYAEAEGNLAAVSRENADLSIAVCCRNPKNAQLLPVSDFYRGGEKLAGSPVMFARPGVQTGYILTTIGYVFARLSEEAPHYDSHKTQELYQQIMEAEPGDIVHFGDHLFFRLKGGWQPEPLSKT
jgi:hypothetical protein